jgi:hypothetical protein
MEFTVSDQTIERFSIAKMTVITTINKTTRTQYILLLAVYSFFDLGEVIFDFIPEPSLRQYGYVFLLES